MVIARVVVSLTRQSHTLEKRDRFVASLLAMTNEKGVHKGEFFPPCTEEEALSSSVGFCFLCFFAFEGYRGKFFRPLILREVSPSVSFCLLCLFSFAGGYKGGEAPIIVWIPDRNIQE